MVALIAASGKVVVTAVLAFGGRGPLRYWRGLGRQKESSTSSSPSSWSGDEIIGKIRRQAQIDTDNRGKQAMIKINKVIQQEADLQQQQLMIKNERRQQNNNGTDIDATSSSSSTSGSRAGLQQRSSKQRHKFARRLTVQVCLSPGCIADGAAVTMEKLQALAPANVRIQQGGCSSFCGSGPVVVTVLEELASSSSRPVLVEQKSHKRILNDKILQLVYPPTPPAAAAATDDATANETDDMSKNNGPPSDLVQGYDLALQGDAAFANMDFFKAMEYYEQAVRVSFISAVELQNERDRFQAYWAQHEQPQDSTNVEDDSATNVDDSTTTTTTTRIPVELEWLIRARRNEARCKLELGIDVEGAVLAAQASCNLSRNTSSESFHVLAEVYNRQHDVLGEMQALQKMMSLPSSSSSSSGTSATAAAASMTRSQRQQQFAMENQRRIASIRLQKLEREYNQGPKQSSMK